VSLRLKNRDLIFVKTTVGLEVHPSAEGQQVKKLKVYLGHIVRDIERKINKENRPFSQDVLAKSYRLLVQTKDTPSSTAYIRQKLRSGRRSPVQEMSGLTRELIVVNKSAKNRGTKTPES